MIFLKFLSRAQHPGSHHLSKYIIFFLKHSLVQEEFENQNHCLGRKFLWRKSLAGSFSAKLVPHVLQELSHSDLMDWSPLGSSIHETSQARILEWVAISFSRGSSRPRDQTHVSYASCITGRFFTV